MAKPIFTQQPLSHNVLPGATLHVGVLVNDPTATLKVLKDGVVIPGEVLSDYIVGAAQASDAGAYSWVATNPSGSIASNRAAITVGAVKPPPIVVPPTSLVVLAPGSTLSIPDMNNVPWRITADGIVLQNGGKVIDGSSGLTRYQGVMYRQDTLSKTWWTIINGVVAQSGTDPTQATPPPTWDPAVAPPIVVIPVPPVTPIPPIVIPPPAGAVLMPKVVANYPVDATLVSSIADLPAAFANGPVRLGRNSYQGSIVMTSGQQLYGLPGNLSDCTGLTIDLPDSTHGCVISGLFGAKIRANGHVYGNLFRNSTWCDINVQSGLFEDNLVYGWEAAINVNANWKNNRIIWLKRHASEKDSYDMTIISPPGRVSINNSFLGGTAQSLPKAKLVKGQGDMAIVGLDVEQSPTIMEASDNGTIRVAVLNGGGNSNSGFTIGGDELQLVGGKFGAPGPTVISNDLKRLFAAGISYTTSGSIGSLYNETSSAALLAPILAPVRIGVPWERPNLTPVPVPTWPGPPAGYHDSTADIQAMVNAGFIPAGIFYIDGTIKLRNKDMLIGAGRDKTILWCTRQQDAYSYAGDSDGTPATNGAPGAFHICDLTIYGAKNGIHANNKGDQLTDCTISFVRFRSCVAGFSAELIYGVDNNFFDNNDFVSCSTGVAQIGDPNYSGGETGTMAYFDKTVWYACQFLGCTTPANMQAKRANNLDAFIYCTFADNKSMGIYSGSDALMFAQCDMLRSGLLQSQLVYLVGVKADVGQFTGDITAEGCDFGNSTFQNPGNVLLLNSRGSALTGKQLNCGPNAIGQFLFGGTMA